MQAIETTNKPWTVMLSATMQTAAVGSAVLLSILQFQTLDLRGLIQPPPLVAPYRPEPVKVVSVERSAGSARVVMTAAVPKVFVAPARIPDRIAKIVDPDPGGPVIEIGRDGFIPSEHAVPLPGVLGASGTAAPRVAPPVAIREPPKTASPEPLRIGGNVLEAKLIHKVVPVYPQLARAARVSGTVHLIGVIGRDGTVQRLQVVDGHGLLISAAIEAVRQWIYRPTLLNGDPVEVVAPIEVKFVLN